jgi:hypothetical protein
VPDLPYDLFRTSYANTLFLSADTLFFCGEVTTDADRATRKCGKFDFPTSKLTMLTSSLSKRYDNAMSKVDDEIFLFGGTC